MNLRWNGTHRRWEVEFSTDFQGDLVAVKAAGFKTEGPPEWVWYSYKAEPLQKLRENRPASGLTITPEAREQFTALVTVEAKNAETKAQLAEHNKVLKKNLKTQKLDATALVIPEKGYIDATDLPLHETEYVSYVPPSPPDTLCIVCKTPIYFYELQDPSICLFCEKEVLDFQEVL